MDQEEVKLVQMKDCEAVVADDGKTEENITPANRRRQSKRNGNPNNNNNNKNKQEVDFCFSGGGIRACATAAGIFEGVLKTQTPDGTKPSLVYRPRFYSCVSGGMSLPW
jgi:hypothetical protein